MLAELLTAPGIAVAALFVVAAVLKLRNIGDFAQQLSELRGLPAVLQRPGALAVPALELVGAGLVFAPGTRTAGLWLLLALLAMFTIVVASNILAGNVHIACACFGSRRERRISDKEHRELFKFRPKGEGRKEGVAAFHDGDSASSRWENTRTWIKVSALGGSKYCQFFAYAGDSPRAPFGALQEAMRTVRFAY